MFCSIYSYYNRSVFFAVKSQGNWNSENGLCHTWWVPCRGFNRQTRLQCVLLNQPTRYRDRRCNDLNYETSIQDTLTEVTRNQHSWVFDRLPEREGWVKSCTTCYGCHWKVFMAYTRNRSQDQHSATGRRAVMIHGHVLVLSSSFSRQGRRTQLWSGVSFCSKCRTWFGRRIRRWRGRRRTHQRGERRIPGQPSSSRSTATIPPSVFFHSSQTTCPAYELP